MTAFHRASLTAMATLLMSSAGAFAADLYGGGMKDGGGSMAPSASRPALFYFRGDYTNGWSNYGSITEAPNFTESATSMANTRAWGGGVGMHITPSVRGDLTLDWSNTAAVHGSVSQGSTTVPGERQFGVKHVVGLANLYYDFDTHSRFSPYLGVGLGFSRNTTTPGSVVITGCAAATCSALMDGTGKTNAAGALMAGFTTKLADRWSLDAGYRFVYLGDASTSDIQIARNPPSPGSPNSTPAVQVHDLYEHELRVGLRMDLR